MPAIITRQRIIRPYKPPVAAAPAGFSWNPVTQPAGQYLSFGAGPVTFSSITFTAGYAVVAVGNQIAGTNAVTSLTVGGNSASLISAAGGTGGADLEIWGVTLASGGSFDVVVSYTSSGLANVCMAAGVLAGANSTPTASVVNAAGDNDTARNVPHALNSLTVPAGGVGIAAFSANFGAATPSWTVGTDDGSSFEGTGNQLRVGLASITTTSAPTLNSYAFSNVAMLGEAFGPA